MVIQSISFLIYGSSLLLSLFNLTVNGSLIPPSSCRYPNSELCNKYYQRNPSRNSQYFDKINFNRDFDVTYQHNPKYMNEEFINSRTFDEDIEKLREVFEELVHRPKFHANENLGKCINLADDSCNNGSLPGSGKDDDYLIGIGNPGKRSQPNGMEYNCMNLGDERCLTGSFPGSGKDDFGNPGKRFY